MQLELKKTNPMNKLLGVLLIILAAVLIFAIELCLIKWAITLFYPITWLQAFGISVLLSIVASAFRSRKK